MTPKLKIKSKFRDALPDLTAQELKLLEESILKNKSIDIPIIVWGDVIIDGHNRYSICKKYNINIPPDKIIQKSFKNDDDALNFIYRTQLERRNLNSSAEKYLIGKIYKNSKQPRGGSRKSSGQNVQLKTSADIAKAYKINERTVRRAESFSDDIDKIEKGIGVDIKNRLLAEEIFYTFEDVRRVVVLKPEEQKKIFEDAFRYDIPLRNVYKRFKGQKSKAIHIDEEPFDFNSLKEIKIIIEKASPKYDIVEIIAKKINNKWKIDGRIRNKMDNSMKEQLVSYMRKYNLNKRIETVIWQFGIDSIHTNFSSMDSAIRGYIKLNNFTHEFEESLKIGICETDDLIKLVSKISHRFKMSVVKKNTKEYLVFKDLGRESRHALREVHKIKEKDYSKIKFECDTKIEFFDDSIKRVVNAGSGMGKNCLFVISQSNNTVVFLDDGLSKVRTINVDFITKDNSKMRVFDGTLILDIFKISNNPDSMSMYIDPAGALIEVKEDDVEVKYYINVDQYKTDVEKVHDLINPDVESELSGNDYILIEMGLNETEAKEIWSNEWKSVSRGMRVEVKRTKGLFTEYVLEKIKLVLSFVDIRDKNQCKNYLVKAIKKNWDNSDIQNEITLSKDRSIKSSQSRKRNKIIQELNLVQEKCKNEISNITKRMLQQNSKLVEEFIDKTNFLYQRNKDPLENYDLNILIRNKCNERLRKKYPSEYNTEIITKLSQRIEQFEQAINDFDSDSEG